MKRYLTAADAAEYLGMTRAQLYDWVRRGLIPCNRLNGRTLRFDMQDLDLWMRRQRVDVEAVQ